MHVWTRLKAESQGRTGLGIYPDGMVEHDEMVGQMLKALEDFGDEMRLVLLSCADVFVGTALRRSSAGCGLAWFDSSAPRVTTGRA